MQLHVRSLQASDLAVVTSIAQYAEHNSWTQSVFADCLKEPYLNWVFYSGESGAVIGFLVALLQGDECHIMNIGIDKQYWRLGYADRLMTNLITKLTQETMITRIFLEVRRSNTAAVALYKKQGFVEIGSRKGYYPRTQGKEDALVFCLEIQ